MLIISSYKIIIFRIMSYCINKLVENSSTYLQSGKKSWKLSWSNTAFLFTVAKDVIHNIVASTKWGRAFVIRSNGNAVLLYWSLIVSDKTLIMAEQCRTQGVRSWKENARRKQKNAHSCAWRHMWQSRRKFTVNRQWSKRWFLDLVSFYHPL